MTEMRISLHDARENPEKTICSAARNDYSREGIDTQSFEESMESIEGDTIGEKKETLIHHLLQQGHYGPFEHVEASFYIKGVSRSLMSQLTRHRLATYDIQSMRYVPFDNFDTDEEDLKSLVVHPPSTRDPDWIGRNQEGGTVDEETVEKRAEAFHRTVKQAVDEYQNLLELGMPPEDARYVLPIGTRTNILMTMNCRQLLHVGDMRAAANAQWEIRRMTEEILDLAADWCPITFEYYDNKMKNRKNRLAP